MTFLELVQKAVRKSGAKVTAPSTVVAQTGISLLFVEWVQEAWKKIQMERMGVGWRVSRDLEIDPLTVGVDEYNLAATLEYINPRTLKIDLADENETPMEFRTYDYYITRIERGTMTNGPPRYFTFTPDRAAIIVWPPPDAAYTIRYEGVLAVEIFDYTDSAGAGTSDALTPTGLPLAYQDAIVWEAVRMYAMNFEDGSKLAEAQAQFLPYKKYFEERYMPIVQVDTTALYSFDWYNA